MGTKERRKYTDREKAKALAIVDMEGGNVYKASQMTGIPHTTLSEWAAGHRGINEDIPDLRTQQKNDMVDLFDGVIVATLENMLTDGSMQRANFQQKAIAVGILYDKRALLLGQPTLITESLLSDEAKAERVAILLEQARQRQLTGSPAGDTIPGSLTAGQQDDSEP